MGKGSGTMKRNPDIRTVTIGVRTLYLIEGLTLKKYIPEAIVPHIHMALEDQNMQWTDEVISKCVMVISHGINTSVMYEHEPIKFDGLLLFTFCMDPKNEYCFGFPKKGNHIEYYTKRR